MFIDTAQVHIKAGDGGNGALSFRHEKFVDKGGPDGGDGGRGGNVVFVADVNANTLSTFRYQRELRAGDGAPGSKRRMHGRSADDLLVKVPVGTQVLSDGQLVADLTAPGQQAIVARGGDGGFGNAHFTSSVRQAPRIAELGEKGQEFTLQLELKLLADVGLVGFPNAGKSTFLSVVSNARPEIADYPFTTLSPHLGVAPIDDTSLLIADIPGLIAGASQGKGLGDEFLRHIERTAVLLQLVDIYDDDVAASYRTIHDELAAYSPELATRPALVALTKAEGLPEDGVQAKLAQLQAAVPPGTPVLVMSAQAHQGVQAVLRQLARLVEQARVATVPDEANSASDEATQVQATGQPHGTGATVQNIPVIGLSPEQKRDAWHVTRSDGRFIITGPKIEKFAARTNFASEPGRRRLWDIMRKMGIMHELQRQGVQPGDAIVLGDAGEHVLTHGA